MVKQVRVCRNVAVLGVLSGLVLMLVAGDITGHVQALVWGGLLGLLYGWLYWHHLSRRVARRHHRYERNKIFVRFLSLFELLLTAAAFSHLVLIILVGLLLALIMLGLISGVGWIILIGTFGVTAATVLLVAVIHYERRYGPLYYQYYSATWMGTEGLLYQIGTVTQPLSPKGKIWVEGELWQAVSLSGETIPKGERVEVIDREGLTLYVDRLPPGGRTRR